MDKEIFQHLAQNQRLEHIEAICDQIIENHEYLRPLSGDEIQQVYHDHAEDAAELSRLQDALKVIQDEYKEKMKPYQEAIKVYLHSIKTKHVIERGTVYKIVDHEAREVGLYSASGVLISGRPAFGNELNRTTFSILREGTK